MSLATEPGPPVFVFYLAAVASGFFLFLCLFILSLVNYPKSLEGASLVLWFLLEWLTFTLVGTWFGSHSQLKAIPIAFCLLAFYLFLTTWTILNIIHQNQEYGGEYWVNRFFYSPIVLYLLPVVVTVIGAYVGSARSAIGAILICASLAVGLVTLRFSRSSVPRVRRANYSFNLAGGKSNEIDLKVDFKFGFQVIDYPMEFRSITENPDDSFQKLTVIRRTSEFHPNTKMLMNIDGRSIENMMWPINQPDGTSRLEFTGKEDYSPIANWKMEPHFDLARALASAHRVEIEWGNFHTVLPEEQVSSLRNFLRSWGKVVGEEGALCTTAMCVRPLPGSSQ